MIHEEIQKQKLMTALKSGGQILFTDPPMPTSGSKTTFSTGAVRDSTEGKSRMELIPWDLMSRVAKRYEDGAKAYGNNNWRKGQLSSHVFASMMRHAMQWVIGDRSEDHLSAVVWNALALMNNEEYFSTNEAIHDIATWYDNGKPTGR